MEWLFGFYCTNGFSEIVVVTSSTVIIICQKNNSPGVLEGPNRIKKDKYLGRGAGYIFPGIFSRRSRWALLVLSNSY